jgi:pyrimidine operon attenuation protein/uracil phosphoribosyltransferase
MAETRTPILDHQAILVKIDRMACEICEKHTESSRLILCGMNSRGFDIAKRLASQIAKVLPSLIVDLVQVDTHSGSDTIFTPATKFSGEQVVVVDDVINTGKTLMHVLQKIFNENPSNIETAFLAKREHRNYPVKADYVGISLATTLQEHVVFDNQDPSGLQVYLN